MALTFLRPFIGGFYVPGMGLALGILGILLIGYLVSKGASSVLTLVETPFTNLPVVRASIPRSRASPTISRPAPRPMRSRS